jgi:hypothetical protein
MFRIKVANAGILVQSDTGISGTRPDGRRFECWCDEVAELIVVIRVAIFLSA